MTTATANIDDNANEYNTDKTRITTTAINPDNNTNDNIRNNNVEKHISGEQITARVTSSEQAQETFAPQVRKMPLTRTTVIYKVHIPQRYIFRFSFKESRASRLALIKKNLKTFKI